MLGYIMKDVVLYLTRRTDSNLEELSHSIDRSPKNILPSSLAEVFIFHEPDVGKLHGKNQMVKPIFCKVDFSLILPTVSGPLRFQVGYWHMCRSFINKLFLRPELEGYDYVMREDVDSSVLSPIRKNMMFHTSFEIYEMAWFSGAAWQDFFKAIDEAQEIWCYRWGNNVIRYLGVKALMPPERIWCATPLHYKHVYTWKAGSSHQYLPRLLQCYAQMVFRLLREKFKYA